MDSDLDNSLNYDGNSDIMYDEEVMRVLNFD